MKIAVTSKAFSHNEILVQEISKHFQDIKFNLSGKLLVGDALYDFLGDRDGAIVAMEEITAEVVEKLPNLKVIAKFGVGLNNIDINYCQKSGLEVLWSAGVNAKSVAEMSLGFMLMLLRNLYLTSNQLSAGNWNKSGGHSLYGKTIGIIGLGHIGQELVRLLQPFNCRILVNDIVSRSSFCQKFGLQEVSKEVLCRQADIVTIHTPLNAQTRQLVDHKLLASMGKDAYLLNTARGEIVDLSALKQALITGVIAGAAIDVYDVEPPCDAELLALPNLICTPHIGGNSREATLAMGRSAIKHIVEYSKRGFNAKK
jgi:phosphoglycerate dehydrogenase-like enzyme